MPNLLVGHGGRQSYFFFGSASHCDHFSLQVTDKASVKYVQQICKAIFVQDSVSQKKNGNYPAPCSIRVELSSSVQASRNAVQLGSLS